MGSITFSTINEEEIMNTFYRIVLTVAMLSFYSISWADPVPLPCEPNCTVDPCSPPLGPKPDCPGYPSPGPVGESAKKTQSVDPCQYGCPKSGCPQCPEGGPIESKKGDKAATDNQTPADSKAKASYDSDKCISSCDMQYDSCIKRGNTNAYCSDQLDTCHKGCLRKN